MSKTLFYIALGAITLCYLAFDNRSPILTENSWRYLNSGFNGHSQSAESLFYGFFAARTSWGRSLWFTIFTQSLVLSGVIYLYYKYFCKNRYKLLYFLANIFLITFSMSGSLLSSSISPGIFTYIGILSVGILLFAKELEKLDKFVVYILLMFSLLVNDFSLIFVSAIAIVGIFIAYFHRPIDKNSARIYLTPAILLLSIAICMSISFVFSKKTSSETDRINIVIPHIESTNLVSKDITTSVLRTGVRSALKNGFTIQPRNKLFTVEEIKEIRQWFANDFRELSLGSQMTKPLDMRYLSVLQIGIFIFISFCLIYRLNEGNLNENKLTLFFISAILINLTLCFVWPEISPDIQSCSLFILSIPFLLTIAMESKIKLAS